MIELRLATWDHVPELIEMSARFHETTPYASMEEFDESRAAEVIMESIEDKLNKIILVLVDTETDKPVGMLIAATAPMGIFSRSKIAFELAWWVNPEHRTKESVQLLNGYLYWAENVTKASIVQSALLEDEKVERISKIYKRKGFTPVERVFVRKV